MKIYIMNKKKFDEFRTNLKIGTKELKKYNKRVFGLDPGVCGNKKLDIFKEYGISHLYSRCDYLFLDNILNDNFIVILETTKSHPKFHKNNKVTRSRGSSFGKKRLSYALELFLNDFKNSPELSKTDSISFQRFFEMIQNSLDQTLLTDQQDERGFNYINSFDCKQKLDGTLMLLLALYLDGLVPVNDNTKIKYVVVIETKKTLPKVLKHFEIEIKQAISQLNLIECKCCDFESFYNNVDEIMNSIKKNVIK